jgi:curved DNA-binding protein CbpA
LLPSADISSRAAKKATLLLHPDRNPDDPDAASRFADFQAVCQVFESEEARKEFDGTGNVEDIKDLRQRLRGLTLEK